MDQSECRNPRHCEPWNKGKLVGQKAPLGLKEICAIRIRLQLAERVRELALFNLAVDSKLRSCDLVKLRTREAIAAWISYAGRRPGDFLFPSRLRSSPHLSTRQYVRIVRGWAREIKLNPATYGTHALRRTKAALIYRRTNNLRAVQLLLGHSKLQSTVRYLGIEVEDALEMAEHTEV